MEEQGKGGSEEQGKGGGGKSTERGRGTGVRAERGGGGIGRRGNSLSRGSLWCSGRARPRGVAKERGQGACPERAASRDRCCSNNKHDGADRRARRASVSQGISSAEPGDKSAANRLGGCGLRKKEGQGHGYEGGWGGLCCSVAIAGRGPSNNSGRAYAGGVGVGKQLQIGWENGGRTFLKWAGWEV